MLIPTSVAVTSAREIVSVIVEMSYVMAFAAATLPGPMRIAWIESVRNS
jgi:hypothetical protein